jgi:hypothetical protein
MEINMPAMQWIMLSLIAFLFLGAGPSEAVILKGSRDCGEWIASRKPESRNLHPETWLVGFLSGIAIARNVEFWQNATPITSDQAYLWIDKWCRENPLTHISEGAVELFYLRSK